MPKPKCKTIGTISCKFCGNEVDVRFSEKMGKPFGYCPTDGKFGERKGSAAEKYVEENMKLFEPVISDPTDKIIPEPVSESDDDGPGSIDGDSESDVVASSKPSHEDKDKPKGGGVWPYFR